MFLKERSDLILKQSLEKALFQPNGRREIKSVCPYQPHVTKVVNDNATRLAHAQDMLKALNEFKSVTPVKQALDDKTKRELYRIRYLIILKRKKPMSV